MKKGLLGILAVGMLTTAANAGTLSMRFAGGGTEVTLDGGSQSVTIEVLITMGAQDGPKTPSRLTGLDLRFDVGSIVAGEAASAGATNAGYVPEYVSDGSTKFVTTGVSSPIAGWSNGATILGDFNRLGTFASTGDPAGLIGPTGATLGTTHVMSITIHKASFEAGDTAIVFREESPLPALYNGSAAWGNRFGYAVENGRNQFIEGDGSAGDADPRFAPYHGYATTFAPLIIHNVPEPSSIALMVLGGLAALRRRN